MYLNDFPVQQHRGQQSGTTARNIADFPFLNTCSDRQRKEIESSVRKGVDRCAGLRGLTIVDSAQLQALERQFVIDLQAVSGLIEEPVKPESQPPGDSEPTPQPAVAGDSRVLLNEEDHLRIQVHRDGLDLHTAWAEANRVDDSIEQHLNFAFNPQWGYLTACPADVGTGMRVSVLLHLPALVMTGKIKEFLRRLKPLNVVGRELFGDPGGDFFRLSNQATLGWNESELIAQVEKAARSVVQAERTARQQLMANEKDKLTYEINVAIEQLLSADLEDTAEENLRQTTRFLSRVRMGIGMELVDQVDTHRVVSKFESDPAAKPVGRSDFHGRLSAGFQHPRPNSCDRRRFAMIIDEMTDRCGEWLKGCGPESDIVMSSRVRLARNLADYPFIRKCTDIDRANIESTVRERLSKDSRLDGLTFHQCRRPRKS